MFSPPSRISDGVRLGNIDFSTPAEFPPAAGPGFRVFFRGCLAPPGFLCHCSRHRSSRPLVSPSKNPEICSSTGGRHDRGCPGRAFCWCSFLPRSLDMRSLPGRCHDEQGERGVWMGIDEMRGVDEEAYGEEMMPVGISTNGITRRAGGVGKQRGAGDNRRGLVFGVVSERAWCIREDAVRWRLRVAWGCCSPSPSPCVRAATAPRGHGLVNMEDDMCE